MTVCEAQRWTPQEVRTGIAWAMCDMAIKEDRPVRWDRITRMLRGGFDQFVADTRKQLNEL